MKKKKNEIPNLEVYLTGQRRHLVSYHEGARIFGIPYYGFVRLAREAGASFVAKKIGMADLDIIEGYLEEHPEAAERVEELRRL